MLEKRKNVSLYHSNSIEIRPVAGGIERGMPGLQRSGDDPAAAGDSVGLACLVGTLFRVGRNAVGSGLPGRVGADGSGNRPAGLTIIDLLIEECDALFPFGNEKACGSPKERYERFQLT